METSTFPYFDRMNKNENKNEDIREIIRRYFNYLILLFGDNTRKAYLHGAMGRIAEDPELLLQFNTELNKEISNFSPDLENIYTFNGVNCFTINKKLNPDLGNYISSNFDVEYFNEEILGKEKDEELGKILGFQCGSNMYENTPGRVAVSYDIFDRNKNKLQLFGFSCSAFTKDIFHKCLAVENEILKMLKDLKIDIGFRFNVFYRQSGKLKTSDELKETFKVGGRLNNKKTKKAKKAKKSKKTKKTKKAKKIKKTKKIL